MWITRLNRVRGRWGIASDDPQIEVINQLAAIVDDDEAHPEIDPSDIKLLLRGVLDELYELRDRL